MFERIPVRLKLSMWHGLTMAILSLITGGVLYKTVEKQLYDSIDAALISSAHTIRDNQFALEDFFDHYDDIFQEFFDFPFSSNDFPEERIIKPYAKIISTSGKIHSKTNNAMVNLPVTIKAVSQAEKGQSTFEVFTFKGRAPLRQLTIPVIRRGEFTGELIQVGASLKHTMDTLKGLRAILWIIFPLVMILSGILGYFLSAWALKPVRDITETASKMGVNALNTRLPVSKANDELRALSQGFNELLARLEDAVKRLRRFAGDVSHELRTPLAVLRGEAELALRKPRTIEEYQSALKVTLKESAHMSSIIEDLLLLARAESRSLAMSWQNSSIQSFVAQLVDETRHIFSLKQVHLKTCVPETGTFHCSSNFLFLALKNILLNAAKHSSSGSEVEFKLAILGDHVTFSISDQGEGIAEENLPNIFDPFFRIDTARNRASGGVGLGLSLALALIKLHHGDIDVTSKVGEGTTFVVSIPSEERKKLS